MIHISDVITYAVAVIGCLIGIAGYFSAINVKANKDGQMLERIEHMCRSMEELKTDLKSEVKDLKSEVKENRKGVDRTLDNHTERLIKLEDAMKEMWKKVETENE